MMACLWRVNRVLTPDMGRWSTIFNVHWKWQKVHMFECAHSPTYLGSDKYPFLKALGMFCSHSTSHAEETERGT